MLLVVLDRMETEGESLMTREEIREGIDESLTLFAEGWLSMTELKMKLSELGVVIKVDGDKPWQVLNVAVESLIEER